MRDLIVERLAKRPPLEELFTADDLEKQTEAARQVLKPAAVLLLVVNQPQGPTVLLTQRTTHLSAHAGQIAFPGGSCDEEDCTPENTALREAKEEVGIAPERIQLLGRLPEYRTVTGFEVTPVIGVVPPDLVLVPSAGEVAQVFEVPLGFVLDTANHVEATVEWQGRNRHYYEISWDGHRIWGATAAMIVNLSRRLRWNG